MNCILSGQGKKTFVKPYEEDGTKRLASWGGGLSVVYIYEIFCPKVPNFSHKDFSKSTHPPGKSQ